jgi:hypothetical protein
MLKVGDLITLKQGLVLGKAYGTIHFGSYHSQYLGKMLRVTKISKVGTAYCSYKGYPCEFSTLHESMVNVAKFNVDDTVNIWNLKLETDGYTGSMLQYAGRKAVIEKVLVSNYQFYYLLDVDGNEFRWPEKCLSNTDSLLEDLKPVLENEDRLQKQETLVSIGERVKGSRVLGRLGKTSVRSRPLRNPQRIRGK